MKTERHQPAWSGFDCYLFDIDGTLLNSRDGVHYNAFHSALRVVWSVEERIDNVPVHGNTDIGILRATAERAGVFDAVFQERLPRALEVMRNEVARNANEMRPQLCPDISQTLGWLRQTGKLLGVVSGNLEAIGWTKLAAAGIRDFFSFGSFSDSNEAREAIFRAGIAQARTRLSRNATICFIGDTPADIAAAKALGLPVLAIATGIYTRDQLQPHSPDYCVDCCTELLDEVRGGADELKPR